ncbi:MAG: hypothetical protein ABIO45_13970 [Burkholderiaceae bacterium]
MRAIFGVVSLLIVLAIIGGVAVKQMRASSQATGQAALIAAPPTADGAAAPAPAGNVREQSQQLQQRVRDDVSRALEQGAAARKAEADK